MRQAIRMLGALGLLTCSTHGLAAPTMLEQKVRMLALVVERAESEAAKGSDMEELKRLLATSRQALAAGDWAAVEQASDQGLRLAAQLLNRGRAQGPTPKQLQERLEQRLRGVEQFRRTLVEILEERGAGAASPVSLEAIDARVARSKQAAAAGNLPEADRMAREAYDLLATAMVRLRDRQTLHHKLVFDSPAAEYRYEQERFRSFRMLLDMALGELPAGSPLARDARRFAEAAAALEQQAGAFAAAGDYPRAIETAEAASTQMIRALREANLFLPF